ncbi:hypothetical protein GCM10010430_27820 [Kitasatospora cystarginea]|uniref:Alcohol dehydrogenase-like N-terminal domain-containing protein n=1 Tax=Kitasatospora cystarginea TaxID=58350 RepID=A0ABP5QUA2_9ACTN
MIRERQDAVVRVDVVTVRGMDLHILEGDVPEVTDGRILGYGAVSTVIETGPGVRSVADGDRVLVSRIFARAARCPEGRPVPDLTEPRGETTESP